MLTSLSVVKIYPIHYKAIQEKNNVIGMASDKIIMVR
jgi:hypothetical protein